MTTVELVLREANTLYDAAVRSTYPGTREQAERRVRIAQERLFNAIERLRDEQIDKPTKQENSRCR